MTRPVSPAWWNAPVASWNGPVTSTPRPASSLPACSMSDAIRCSPCTVPGSASVRPSPKMIEQAEPGGVTWMIR
ncbi:hypothetical protein [Nonomuraea rubra]|uniref:hypothetical protein n=1 Tax=Nonomuraea rubra TaxID=46180 RepID=UPI0033CE0B44